MRENVVKDKSFAFAVRIVNLYKILTGDRKEYILSKQLLRSGTAVGAMCRESEQAESKADFIHKLSIGQKECNESIYWIELLKETGYISEKEFSSLSLDAIELIKLITSIIKTTKKNLTSI